MTQVRSSLSGTCSPYGHCLGQACCPPELVSGWEAVRLGISPYKGDELFHGACPVERAVGRGKLKMDSWLGTWGPALQSSVAGRREQILKASRQ